MLEGEWDAYSHLKVTYWVFFVFTQFVFFHLSGSQCEVNINECESNPCQHGVCIDKINAFQCLCHPGYTGPECGSKFNECTSNLCLNGGVCIDKATDYACDCGIGYEGKHCENDIDLCKKPEICSNFQSCTDKGSHADCVCKAGFTGNSHSLKSV